MEQRKVSSYSMYLTEVVTMSPPPPAKPGFFKTNWLWLGKTYYQLSRRAEAREWLQKLLAANTNDPDDDEVSVLPPSLPPSLSTPSPPSPHRLRWRLSNFFQKSDVTNQVASHELFITGIHLQSAN